SPTARGAAASARVGREGAEREGGGDAVGRNQLDAVAHLAQRGGGRDPALPDDVLEEPQQVHGPGGEVRVGDERDIAAALPHRVGPPAEGDRPLDGTRRRL